MRLITAAVLAATLGLQTLTASALPSMNSTGVNAQSTFELIKTKKKKAKKAKKAKKGGVRAGKCGVGKYYKKGKCESKYDAPKKPWSVF